MIASWMAAVAHNNTMSTSKRTRAVSPVTSSKLASKWLRRAGDDAALDTEHKGDYS
jgi:hypothetical protein